MEIIEDYSLENTCRTCLKNEKNDCLIPIFENNEQQQVGELFERFSFINFKVNQDDGLPQHICVDCLDKLYSATEFFECCEKSQEIIEQHFSTRTVIINSTKIEFVDPLEYMNSSVDESKYDADDHLIISDSLKNSPRSNGEEEKDDSENIYNKSIKKIENCEQKKEPLCFGCSICGKLFEDAVNLKSHVDTHSNENMYNCEVCGKGFNNVHYLRRHKQKHEPNKRHKCEYCDKSFVQKHHKVNHERMHTGERPFLCNLCGKSFMFQKSLEVHTLNHNGERPHTCDECGKSFTQRATLKTHKHRIHSSNNIVNVQSVSRDEEERKHACNECGKMFKRPEHLKIHINGVHLKIKPFACEVCGKRFTQSGDVKPHMKVHTGEKPHTCPFCPRKFILAQSMRDHAWRIHKSIIKS